MRTSLIVSIPQIDPCLNKPKEMFFSGGQDRVKDLQSQLSGFKQRIDSGIKLELLQAKRGKHHPDNIAIPVQPQRSEMIWTTKSSPVPKEECHPHILCGREA